MWQHPAQGMFVPLHGIKRPTRRPLVRRLRALITSLVMCVTFVANSLWAAEATLSWTPPTENTDGSTLTNLAGFRIHYGLDGPVGPNLNQTITINNPGVVTYKVEQLGPGKWSFAVTAFTSAGAESQRSNITQREFLPPQIAPIAPVVTQANINVYSISKRLNGFVLLVVGTVPAGTACDPTQSVNGMYVVPKAAVTFSGDTRPDVVVADCD